MAEYDNGGPVERTTRALSCDGTAMELPMVHVKPRTGSLASLGPMPPTLVLTIDKWGLDGAHKDKHHKLYSPEFKVTSSKIIFKIPIYFSKLKKKDSIFLMNSILIICIFYRIP